MEIKAAAAKKVRDRDIILVWIVWFRLAYSSELSCPRVFIGSGFAYRL